MAGADSSTEAIEDAARIAALEVALAELRRERDELQRERDELRAAYDRLWLEVELMRRRIFVAKAERVDTAQLELEFKDKLAELDRLAGTIGIAAGTDEPTDGDGRSRPKPKGRRNLRKIKMPEERVEMPDPQMEALVAAGKAERLGACEESSKVVWQRGGPRRLVLARVKYRQPDAEDQSPETTMIVTAKMPPQMFPRAIAGVSLIAHIAVDKYCDGLPLHRQQDRFARLGVPIDRGTMCRWMEHAGATCGATVVEAMRKDAMANAFCISTDATGVLVQPLRDTQKRRQPCRRGHYFVQIADRDHVFFEYTPKETSAAVGEMFKGFSGYVQADAKSVYDILFRPPPEDPPDDGSADRAERIEVGCAAHARRRLWEATIAKSAVAREGLARFNRIFALERKWKDVPPVEKKALRQAHARPHLEAFFSWAEIEFANVKDQRGLLRTALGYCVRHKTALMRYLDDGRLEPTNNGSERQLRRIAVGRNAWLFVGSDDHAQSAGHLFTLVASARLHKLDPELYLRDLFRVLPHWPRDRYLDLAPKFWASTRARLDPVELAAELGPLTVPSTIDSATEEQPAS
ncbi:MAG: IS66 family transposase [Solirubrobacterales bacterium]|nr:MAG: IS66 family transposase [Solirubrobacterales bacterium]